ncbi:ROK family protein [Streptomyces sp. NPDC005336]|uniref:ROK family protein n=1 Tax=unclassified Streptomyces TaxID=2593676 RepID=UPI00339E555E
MNPAPAYVIGVDVGGTSVKAVVADRNLRTLARWTFRTGADGGPEAATRRILGAVDEVLAYASRMSGRIASMGIGIPGQVDEDAGIGLFSENIGWHDWPVGELAAARTGLPTRVGHDVRLAALAESRAGAGRGLRDLVVVTVGTGVGAAIVLDGRVRPGRRGSAGEIGHLIADPAGPRCVCGKSGCVEAIGSAAALERRYRAESQVPQRVTAQEVAQRAHAGEAVAARLWCEAVHALAHGIAAASAVIDPDALIVGGGLAAAGPALFSPLHAALGTRLAGIHQVPLLPAGLGPWAGAIGAAALAWDGLGTARDPSTSPQKEDPCTSQGS